MGSPCIFCALSSWMRLPSCLAGACSQRIPSHCSDQLYWVTRVALASLDSTCVEKFLLTEPIYLTEMCKNTKMTCQHVDIHFWPCRSIEKQLSGAAITAMLQASLLSREGKAKEADAVLAALATSSDAAQAAEAQLLRAQLAAASGNAAAALQHLAVRLQNGCALPPAVTIHYQSSSKQHNAQFTRTQVCQVTLCRKQ